MPGLEKWVFPWIEEQLQDGAQAAPARTTRSSSLLDQMAERHEHAVALQRLEADGIARTTFRDVRGAIATPSPRASPRSA